MASHSLSHIFVLFTFLPLTLSQSIIQIPTARSKDDDLYCDSWRLSVETNNAGYWVNVPSRCESYVQQYMTSDRFLSDFEVVASDSLSFAKSVNITGDGKDAWVFDIDETLLSNLPYYEVHGFGSQPFDENAFDQWVDLAEAPALQASLNLYKELKHLGFTIFLLTGRSENQRDATVKDLLFAGYSDWEGLFLRGVTDQGTPATVYKSQKRMELVNEGYRIHGSSGDQWSDLVGFAVAKRSFKLPNPMYYIQ
ncbi:acid phosphatase 1 [Ricinus communis]|uniref:Acid phosphatase 1, putative n=1 Tax=Ricinus communis TaxID=3988 RepID=B9RKF1_RICCO|nr:acid phosphatase 1 [Ricinus communis]EEF48149.1 Acid phosphatase 1 precursor, putative [Ricinus communis]|eukprot:XP_002514195.1 acid phosphatase 1 [Ricinus communis]